MSYAELKALHDKRKAECEDKARLLAEAEGLLPQQAPPGSNPTLIRCIPVLVKPLNESAMATPHMTCFDDTYDMLLRCAAQRSAAAKPTSRNAIQCHDDRNRATGATDGIRVQSTSF